jgi:hypothetical protein
MKGFSGRPSPNPWRTLQQRRMSKSVYVGSFVGDQCNGITSQESIAIEEQPAADKWLSAACNRQ